MEPPRLHTSLSLEDQARSCAPGRFWVVYVFALLFSLDPIETYVFGSHFCPLAFPFYALVIAPIAFAVQWPYCRWIRPLAWPLQVPLIVVLAWLSILVARPLVMLIGYLIVWTGLLH